MPTSIIMYSAKLCGDCQNLKAFMDKHGIPYENRDIRENPEYGEELQTKTGKLGVPYLLIDGEWVRGYVPGRPFSEDFARGLFGLAG
ncbi:MAG: glutaredoxin family protein [Candidatus Hydrogenedentes bacterium]|nr:glutaredoxin family protein [Candidatus Hydrogenedentota bacterium]